jgi:hypothetical protein
MPQQTRRILAILGVLLLIASLILLIIVNWPLGREQLSEEITTDSRTLPTFDPSLQPPIYEIPPDFITTEESD